MTPRALPTPADLLSAPELAVLAVLQTTMDVTESTLTSAHPDLYSPDDEIFDPLFTGSSQTVRTLLTLLRALSEQIHVYRLLVDQLQTSNHAPPQDPF
jgi:hypothetical protein